MKIKAYIRKAHENHMRFVRWCGEKKIVSESLLERFPAHFGKPRKSKTEIIRREGGYNYAVAHAEAIKHPVYYESRNKKGKRK